MGPSRVPSPQPPRPPLRREVSSSTGSVLLPLRAGAGCSSRSVPLPCGWVTRLSPLRQPLPGCQAFGVSQAACLPPAPVRVLDSMSASRRRPQLRRESGPWSVRRSAPPGPSPQLHSAGTRSAASSAHLDSVSIPATLAGPIPDLSAPACWCGAVDPGGRLPRRKTKRWCSTSKNRWVAPPRGDPSRRTQRALAIGPERESGSLG